MTGRFYGRVVDANRKGVEAASVVLVQERMDTVSNQRKEVVAGGMLTPANGEFSIENVPAFGRYKLRITGIGFKPYEQNVNFDRPATPAGSDMSTALGALDKDLGNIKLEIDENVLSSVTVTASSKPLLQMGIDRKVFNVDKNIVSAGGNAIDVMKNVPSVNVDIDGNVTLRNNAPQIFVDGRPTNLTLEQIPADAIESVEIITNPSAKFDASGGTAGILNIVLKKNKRVGYAGNVRVNMDSRGRIGGGTDLNVRQNKVNVFVSGNVNQRKSLSWGTTDRQTLSNPKVHTLQDDNSIMKGLFGFGRAGIDYFINNRNTITLSGTMGRGSMRPSTTSDIYTDSLYSAVVNNYSQRNSSSKNEFRNMGTQLSYKHLFPKSGHEWTADITYNRGKNNNSNYIYTDYYKMPQQEFLRRYRQQQLGSGENKNLIVQTDYSKPINDKSKYEIGARATIRDVKSANNFYTVTSSGTLIPLPGQNILYNSKDRVYAAYATYTNRIKNFGYQLGIRAESSDYNGVLPNKGQSFTIKFPLSLFPSVFLTQRVNETDDLQFNYSRRINRPNFWQLFPFTDYSDSLNISRGNPNLKPEFTNSLELSYSKIFKNRDNFIASLYFKNTNDLITRFQTLEQDTFLKRDIIVSTFINANRSYITGLELTARNKLTKFWDLTSNANFFTAKIDLKNEKDPDQFLSYFIKINNTFRLPKNFTLQLSGDYQSRIISSPGSGGGGFGGGGGGRGGGFGNSSAAQGYIRPNYGVDAALRFEFLKNRTASLSLNVNDIFRTRKYSAHTESQFFIQDIERRRDPQVARLNFNWRFGKMDISLFKRRNNRTENEDMDNTNF
ncbi:MAG: TonB-dependent receptor [Flavisolibacter sp.]|nr:TonB-dependent receptor [Flavisolibacter sp.]